MKRQERWTNFIFAAAVLVSMMVFFIMLHPIPIMDEDDVIYTVLVRKAIPIPGGWNPSRLMPEALASLCGHTAAILTRLGFGHFIHCQVAVAGTLLSLFITAYVCAFRRLLCRKLGLGPFLSCCLAVLFLELHFLVYVTEPEGNLHMFHSYNECCMFFYTIPALFCGALMMRLMAEETENPLAGKGLFRQSVWVTAVYFAVFSNLYGSILLSVYAGLRLLGNFLKTRKQLGRKQFWKQNAFWAAVLLLWLLALLLDGTGGRAANVSTLNNRKGSLLSLLGDSAGLFFRTLWNTNLLFRLIALAAVVLLFVLLLWNRRTEADASAIRLILNTLCIGVLCTVFIILLSAVVSPDYTGRPEAIFASMAVLILLMLLCIAAFLQQAPQLAVLLPIALLFVFSMTNTRYRTFADTNSVNIHGQAAVALEDEIYQSIITAAEEGRWDVGVRVPKYNEESNWPHDGNIGAPIAELFLKYGIIDHEIYVWTDPTEELNLKYGITP